MYECLNIHRTNLKGNTIKLLIVVISVDGRGQESELDIYFKICIIYSLTGLFCHLSSQNALSFHSGIILL